MRPMAVYNSDVRTWRRFRGPLQLGNLEFLIQFLLTLVLVVIVTPTGLERLPSNIAIQDAGSTSFNPREAAKTLLKPWEVLAGPFRKYVQEAADQTKISPILIVSVMWVETRIRFQISSAGAIGPMQLLPDTAYKELKVNPWDIRDNILGGALYLQQLLQQFQGDKIKALAAYNTGPGTVARVGITPEGQAYADKVLAVYHAYTK